MVYTVDVGNSNIVAGVWKGDELLHSWRVHTVARKTEDEYAIIFRSLFADVGLDPHNIKASCLSTVVPSLSDPMASMLASLCGHQPIVLGPSVYPHLDIEITRPYEVGTDLVADAVAAWDFFKAPCIVVDFGTALTFTVVNAQAALEGVAIVPGLGTAVSSLSRDTAQLPHVRLSAPPQAFGRNTIEAIQAGIVHGYTGLVQHVVENIKKDLGTKAKVVATGGQSSIISPLCSVFDRVDLHLTLRGLRLVVDLVPRN